MHAGRRHSAAVSSLYRPFSQGVTVWTQPVIHGHAWRMCYSCSACVKERLRERSDKAEQSLVSFNGQHSSYAVPHRAKRHALTVSSSLLWLISLLHERCGAPEAVLWPLTLMSLIRTSVPEDGSLLLLWRSWEGFLTVGTLVLTLAPFLPSDSLRPFPEKEGSPPRRPLCDPVQMSREVDSMELRRIRLQRSFFFNVFLLFYPYPVLYRAVVTHETSFVSSQYLCT